MNPEKTEPDKSSDLPSEASQGGGEHPSPNGHIGNGDHSQLGPFELEVLLSLQVDRRKREAEVEKEEFQAEHEPRRLWMNLLERGTFVVVLVIAALAGGGLIAVGVASNLALVPPGCVLLSAAAGTATYRIYRRLKPRDGENDEPGA